jgi:PncC family amidohydrolase
MVPDAAFPGALARLPFAATLYFPISGNPVGFNHLAAAEGLLRLNPAWRQVVFILSNGRHPDPNKPALEGDFPTRLAILNAALEAVADPARSFLARQAGAAGDTVRLGPQCAGVSTREASHPEAVRSAQMVRWLRAEAPQGQGPVAWCVGTDLLRRMADPRIFADSDLAILARECRFALLERPGEPAEEALALLRERRGVSIAADVFSLAKLPDWLARFLTLSSTLIRRAAESGDPLGGMLPSPAAALIAERDLYREGRVAARLVDPQGRPAGVRTELQQCIAQAEAALAEEAGRCYDLLVSRHAAKRPHGLAIVEGCVGGVLTAALAGRSGASRFFRQARFAYDRQAKVNLLGPYPDTQSALSPEMVGGLAEAMLREARADYCLAESGMAGPPDGLRRSLKSGECWLAVAGPGGTLTRHVALNPFLTRKEHMIEFSRRGLELLREVVAGG